MFSILKKLYTSIFWIFFNFDGSYITNDDEDEVIQNINYSINVEETLYDKEDYKKTLEESDNVLETSWKRRIMIDHTPRGNIIMYYDPYKE